MSTWIWAWSIIWSRGVGAEVPDAQPGAAPGAVLKATALVPFADMLNHAGPKHSNAKAEWQSDRAAWVVRSTAAIAPGVEVLLTYNIAAAADAGGPSLALPLPFGGKGGGSGNGRLLQRYGFVQPGPSASDGATVSLLLGSAAPAAGGVTDSAAADRLGRRALNRALFDAVADQHELHLRPPETTVSTQPTLPQLDAPGMYLRDCLDRRRGRQRSARCCCTRRCAWCRSLRAGSTRSPRAMTSPSGFKLRWTGMMRGKGEDHSRC